MPKPAGDSSKGTVTIAIELPQQGSEKAASDPIINGIKLAVKLAGGTAGGYAIEIPQSAIYDDALNGVHDPQTGANNMSKAASDEATVAVIGPLNSSVAAAQIPITNEAGLLQCSPANTNPDLTKGQAAADLRTKPNNYIRVVTTDDVQGPAAAQYIYDVLGKKSVYVIDDTETFGKGVADAFDAEFVKRGGTVVKHDAAPKTTQDYVSIMTAAKALEPGVDLLRWRHGDGRRADPARGRAGRPRRHPVCRPGRHQRRLRRDQGLVPEPRGRLGQERVQHARRHRRLPGQGPVRS